MKRNLTFFIVFGLGLAFCLGAIYYIFFYQPAPKDSQLGIIFNPGQENYSRVEYLDQIKELEDRQLGIIQASADWGQIEIAEGEYDWKILDQELKYFTRRGWRVSLTVLPINGYALGSWPAGFDFNGFQETETQERYYNFLEALVKRYQDNLDYLVIGQDIDKYLSLNSDKINDYYTFYLYNYYKLKEKYPDLKISTGLSYDFLKASGNLEAMAQVFKPGLDFRAFTYLGAENTQGFTAALEEMLNYAVNDKLALTATGIRVADNNDGPQEKFVQTLLNFNQQNKDKLEFISYYSFKDLPLAYCQAQAEEQLWYRLLGGSTCAQKVPGCDRSMIDATAKEKLAAELCSFGLKDNQGKLRLGWSAFTLNAGLE